MFSSEDLFLGLQTSVMITVEPGWACVSISDITRVGRGLAGTTRQVLSDCEHKTLQEGVNALPTGVSQQRGMTDDSKENRLLLVGCRRSP